MRKDNITASIGRAIKLASEESRFEPYLHEDALECLIDVNYVVHINGGLRDRECKEKLIEYLTQLNGWITTQSLFNRSYPSRQYSRDVMMKDPLFKTRRHSRFVFNWPEEICLVLDEPRIINRSAFIDRNFFDYFFFFRLFSCDLGRIIGFLHFNLLAAFDSNLAAYSFFLERVLLNKYQKQLGKSRSDIIRDYVREIKLLQQEELSPRISLEEMFNNDPVKSSRVFRTIVEPILYKRPNRFAQLVYQIDRLLVEKELWKKENATRLADLFYHEFNAHPYFQKPAQTPPVERLAKAIRDVSQRPSQLPDRDKSKILEAFL